MPRLWSETVEAHRHEVRGAIVSAALALAAEQGPLNVAMSQVAERAGIGRATLYKYFSGVEQILRAWHDEQVAGHLALLRDLADENLPPWRRLTSVLQTYAAIRRGGGAHAEQPGAPELVAFLHRAPEVDEAERQLRALVAELVGEAAASGEVRADVGADELAAYCLHALDAAKAMDTEAAAERLVAVVLDGLRPARQV